MLEYKNILFCTDFSEDANIAFLHALNLARKYSAKLHIIHIPHSPHTYTKNVVDQHVPKEAGYEGQAFFSKEIAEQAEKALSEAYENRLSGFRDYKLVVGWGTPEIEIVRYARDNDIDLIVMGALGNSDDLDLGERGKTLTNVSRFAHCHVMAIKNPSKQFTLPGKMV